jgi:S1-C subfamily serine protease
VVDPSTDVAFLRLSGDDRRFETIELGDSERLQVADSVLALGNPLGLNFTVTAGIVSGKGRQREYGRVRRPRLDIRVSDVTAVDAEVSGSAGSSARR